MRGGPLDHVALWVADRRPLATLLCEHLGMHVIQETDAFTLVGADARRGKLTLFAAEGPREAGVLERVGLRVSDLDGALARLPEGLARRERDGAIELEAPEGLRLALVERPGGVDYDLDHVSLRVPEPDAAREALAELGFERREDQLAAGEVQMRLIAGDPGPAERPLLNHLALLVESADEHIEEARRRGLEIADVVDAENTYALFLWGPAGIKLEYVEHKPGFSLR